MTFKPTLQYARHNFWILSKKHSEPWWARVLATGMLGLWMGFFITVLCVLMGFVSVYTRDNFTIIKLLIFILLGVRDGLIDGMAIAYVMLLLLRGVEWLFSADFLQRISAAQDWRYGTVLATTTLLAVAIGLIFGTGLIGLMETGDFWFGSSHHGPEMHMHTVMFLALAVVTNLLWWRFRLRQQRLRHQAAEAQQRLLQAQIEPHFLFNTLANVQSLMDHDPPRARQLLDGFTEYLRVSLGQLRSAQSTLAAELEMVRNYLQLMKLRMEERLDFVINANDEACNATLPTLLLQPLIENAIKHGLEPKIEGGIVRITAQVQAGRLHIRVADDGLGLDGPSRSLRRGNGVALDNLRERLRTRYATNATLTLSANNDGMGACAMIDIPYESKP